MSKCKHLPLLFTLFLITASPFNSYAGPVCGDGNVDPGEECDTGMAATSLCNNNTDPAGGNGPCMFTICGDNILQSPNGVGFNEECEPPNTATCDNICQTIAATTTTTTTTTTGATTSTTGATTSTTAATTSTTGATTSTTAATTSTTGATTTTTMGGGGTTSTTTAASTTTTTTTTPTTTTTAAATTTTTLPTDQNDDDAFDFGGGGCTISKTPADNMDPVWLFMLLAPGLGLLRRRRLAKTGT